ncbi:MAG: FecR domain-containing protein, partial [Spirochaetaceae bacterium]|nr:FecR domain-containing protein [Spirochaetaceae bacterium]
MNKKIKLSTADILVIILYILGTGVLLKLFYNDLNQTLKKNAPPVAIVTFKEKTIQRHFSDRILWDRLQNKSDVYNGDVIRTSDASNVSVLFNDKNSFDLDENTMAQIFTGKNNTQINLSHGRVVLNASDEGAHLTVVSGNSKVTIEPGSVVEAENSGGNDDITVLVIEGEAALETGAGQTVALKGGDTFNAGHFIAPISPSPSEHFVQTQQEKMFEFLWKTPADYDMNKNTTLRFEVSTDKNFKKIID